MGYSEIYCHICGVSFNVSRLRAAHTDAATNQTTLEPRSSAWQETTKSLGSTFVEEDWTDGCKRDAGCMIVPREDSRVWNLDRQNDGNGTQFWVEDVVEMSEDGEDGEDADYVPPDEEVGDEEYEFKTPPESCSGDENGDFEMFDDGSGEDEASDAPSDVRYREFIEGLKKIDKASPPDAGQEVVLPLFPPLDNSRKQKDDELGSEASFKYDIEKDSHMYSNAKHDHRLHGKLSFWKHPRNDDLRQPGRLSPDYLWEHVAGPGCAVVRGYSGHSISVEEMHGCGTLQCLFRKHEQQHSEFDDQDEDWEQASGWFLTGISDYMPSRDTDSPYCYPVRHGENRPWAENCIWDTDKRGKYAMPFHPTCLEVWKRACLRRIERVDIAMLASWWTLNASYEKFHSFPRDAAVKRGEEQWWQHNIGDEFLAANPCFIPEYEKMLENVSSFNHGLAGNRSRRKLTTERANTVQSDKSHQDRSPQPQEMDVSSDIFNTLPIELWFQVFTYLSTAEVAYLRQANRTFHTLPQSYIRQRLQEERPYLWELWCQRPYSRWTATTASALKAANEQFEAQNREIGIVLRALAEDGWTDERDIYEQYWIGNHDERRAAFNAADFKEKIAIILNEDDVDYAMLAIGLEKRLKKGQLKGLRNRERIWKDCEIILGEVEELKKDLKITADGQIAGKWVFAGHSQ
ncbi:hypothetical protein H2198_006613 [Neophaeococcomyces mojaviensis]|uniref:Uncharacterized protein n=1 Tax=Neophaeococcomyces mojaviensis TaxID=3383035 RepID=A0ACC3A335_9EURO|nr:hypothetical protein H2198_006613 [Knufia sp. JES_112]